MLTVQDIEAAARAKLDPVYADFIAGGARDEITVRADEAAFDRLQLLPRVLRGSAVRELGVTLPSAGSPGPGTERWPSPREPSTTRSPGSCSRGC